jgi:hypothetical protein
MDFRKKSEFFPNIHTFSFSLFTRAALETTISAGYSSLQWIHMSRLVGKPNTVNPRPTRGVRSSKARGSVNPRWMILTGVTNEMYIYTFKYLE